MYRKTNLGIVFLCVGVIAVCLSAYESHSGLRPPARFERGLQPAGPDEPRHTLYFGLGAGAFGAALLLVDKAMKRRG